MVCSSFYCERNEVYPFIYKIDLDDNYKGAYHAFVIVFYISSIVLEFFCSQIEKIFALFFLDCTKTNMEFTKQCKCNMIVIGIERCTAYHVYKKI